MNAQLEEIKGNLLKELSTYMMDLDHHVADMLTSFKDIWRDADPEHKKQLKAELSAFVNQLAV